MDIPGGDFRTAVQTFFDIDLLPRHQSPGSNT